jgi:pimeloyl-ACP methyl ester carboxylesterase
MRRTACLCCLVLGLWCLAAPAAPAPAETSLSRDVVLVHGLANRHRWGEEFLAELLQRWGPGRVYAVYTAEPLTTWRRPLAGGELRAAGDDGDQAGCAPLAQQAALMARAVEALQAREGLGQSFHVIAHSMGGLVARRYARDHPGAVAALVTLGTPHHGSPLAESTGWLARFAGAGPAAADLTPRRAAAFNQACPVEATAWAAGGGLAAVRGACPGGSCFGAYGELALGWFILKTVYGLDNDGLVPWDSALIAGGRHLADFPEYDHLELVQRPEVARAAAQACARAEERAQARP